MNRPRFLPILLAALITSGSATSAYGQSDKWNQLDTGIYEEGSGETVPAGDIVDLWFRNDGTYAYFNETLAGAQNPAAFTYMVYLDKPFGGTYPRDFRLVYSSTASELQKWDGTTWVHVEDITITTSTSPNSITFKASLSSIANPNTKQDTGILFVNYVKDTSIGKKRVDLVYGQDEVECGDVYFSADNTNLYVDIYVDSGWNMIETHLKVSKDELTWSPPGSWPYEHENPPETHDTYVVPLKDIGCGNLGMDPPLGVEPEDIVYIMVHVVIYAPVGVSIIVGESAYGSGNYTIPGDKADAFIKCEEIPEFPWPTSLVFVTAVVTVVYLVYKRNRNGGNTESRPHF